MHTVPEAEVAEPADDEYQYVIIWKEKSNQYFDMGLGLWGNKNVILYDVGKLLFGRKFRVQMLGSLCQIVSHLELLLSWSRPHWYFLGKYCWVQKRCLAQLKRKLIGHAH